MLQLPAPPLIHMGIDLLRPLKVKSRVVKHDQMKVWVVFFLCLNSKAVSMEPAPGYSTEYFIVAYSAHTSQRGAPTFVQSYRDSQLVAAPEKHRR